MAILPQQPELTERLDQLARQLRLQAGQEGHLEASKSLEEALRKCEAVERPLAEARGLETLSS